MEVEHHGGGCCGMRHLYEFGFSGPIANFIRSFERKMKSYDRGVALREGQTPRNILCEAVLTDQQLNVVAANGLTWVQVLREAGFRRVSRFRNGNSDNMCNVFHYTPRRRTHEENLNDPWLAGRPVRRRG
jgi:hypothetical protein